MLKSLTFLLPDGWKGEVVDLSAVGMRLRSLVELPVGSRVQGTLVFPDGQRIDVQAQVVWSSPPEHQHNLPAELGLELRDVPERYLQALAKLFAE